jgi:tripartite-type tricarboxylate transporter receptor subunit TctC
MLPQWAAAQAYPTKPVQMVVPFAAGGPADIMARALALKLAAALKQPMLVINQPGAGGGLGSKAVAQAQPDGYNLLFTLDSTLTANPILYGSKTGFDPVKDLRPITTVVAYGQTLVVHPSLKVTTFSQFLELARKQDLAYASAGNASPGNLTMELLAGLIKAKMTHIPYRGAAPALNDLVGGQVNAGFLVTPGVVPYVTADKLIPLVTSSTQRSLLLPQVPTVSEAGFPAATMEFSMVLLAPAKTPEAIVQRLQKETRDALASEDMQRLMKNNDYTVVADTPEQAKARLASTFTRMSELIATRGIKAE